METIEQSEEWRQRYTSWKESAAPVAANDEVDADYPFVRNRRGPFLPARRALPMLNLALVSSAGAYINGAQPFDLNATDGDFTFREIPAEIEKDDLLFAARGYNPAAVNADPNSELPLARLFEFESNGIIGQLNPVFWSFVGFIPNAARLVDEMLPNLVERLKRYEVQAALFIPASKLCHQSVSLAARAVEQAGIPTMTIGVDRDVLQLVRPPRAAVYDGELGSVAGRPNWPEHQRRIIDEALRLIEPMDQVGIRNLVVDLETEIEKQRGEK